MDTLTLIYFILFFVATYMLSFFLMLTINNRNRLFSYPKPNENFTISIIVPAYNEEDSIKETIENVMNLSYPKRNIEVIVVNDGSKDGTLRVVRSMQDKYPNLKIIDKKNSGKADSLNVALRHAKGELFAVVDSDSFPDKDSLIKLTGFFDDAKMGAVTSFVRVRNNRHNLLGKIQGVEYMIMGWNRKLLDFIDSVYVTNGPLSLYRKSYVLGIGGFDTKTVTEDIDVTWNLMSHGYKTAMCLAAGVSTIAPTKFGVWFRQRTRWGLGGLQAVSKYRKLFLKKGMFGLFVLPFVSFSILLSLFTFLLSIYVLGKAAITRMISTIYSIDVGSTFLRAENFSFYPSIIFIYFAIFFVFSFVYTMVILRITYYENKINWEKVLSILFYIPLYFGIYPAVWFASIYRFVKGDNRW